MEKPNDLFEDKLFFDEIFPIVDDDEMMKMIAKLDKDENEDFNEEDIEENQFFN